MSSQANIRNIFFDQKSPRHPEVGVSLWPRPTDGHGDSMTELAQRTDSVGGKTQNNVTFRWVLELRKCLIFIICSLGCQEGV